MESKTRLRRFLAIFLGIVMIVGLANGCSKKTEDKQEKESGTESSVTEDSSNNETSENDASETQGPLYINGGEGVTLTYWIPMDTQQAQNYSTLAEHPYFQWLEEQTGVKIDFVHPSWEQASQQLNVMIASEDYYDMLYYPEYPGGPQAGIDENCFIDLMPYLDEYMPDYKEALLCDDGSFAAWEWGEGDKALYEPQPQPAFYNSCITNSGALWCVSQIWTDDWGADRGAVIRKDWLDEAGLDVPETLDELEVVLKAFKERGDDVIPMNLGAKGMFDDGAIMSAYDIFASEWEWYTMNPEKTEVRPHAFTQDAFKDYLELLNGWYAEGYIDPDFMNHDDDALTSLFLNDKLGIYFCQWYSPEYWKTNYTGNEEFEVVPMPLPRKTKDQQLKWRNAYTSMPSSYTCITTSCKYPEIAAAWLNVGFTKEGILRATYGVEGTDYEMVDGSPVYTDSVFDQDPEYFQSCYLFPNGSNYNSLRASLLRREKSAISELSSQQQANLVWGQNATPELKWNYVVFEGDDYGLFDAAYNDAATYASPMILKFIIGEESLDKFDEFRETAASLGLDEAREIAQKNLDKMYHGE